MSKNTFIKNGLTFTKSSFSPKNKWCVAVSISGDHVYLTDTKDTNAPILTFNMKEWEVFLAGVYEGEFNLSTGEK